MLCGGGGARVSRVSDRGSNWEPEPTHVELENLV